MAGDGIPGTACCGIGLEYDMAGEDILGTAGLLASCVGSCDGEL
jgi:hypothetical protein